MAKILIVENSKAIAQLVASNIANKLDDIDLTIVNSLEKAQSAMQAERDWLVAVVCLNLPDAPNGEIVDAVQSHDIPVIVLTGTMSPEVRQTMLQKQVIDYVVKSNNNEIAYVANLVKRIAINKHVTILIVDDNRTEREFLRRLLEIQEFIVLEAKNGQAGLEILNKHPEVRMVITDYEMPKMNGVEFVSQLRTKWPREAMAVIGISASSEKNLSAALLKSGANDYIRKPFLVEEFYCRVMQNIELLEHIQSINDLSNRDPLTKLYNRRYLFEKGEQFFQQAKRGSITLNAAMLDIDHFKKINDTHGHKVGDEAICRVAQILRENLPGDCLISRYGGEEFCVLLVNAQKPFAESIFNEVRKRIETTAVPTEEQDIFLTISIGVSQTLGNSMDDLLNNADALLYKAKHSGRNRVILAA